VESPWQQSTKIMVKKTKSQFKKQNQVYYFSILLTFRYFCRKTDFFLKGVFCRIFVIKICGTC
jgi:hypothetical protein